MGHKNSPRLYHVCLKIIKHNGLKTIPNVYSYARKMVPHHMETVILLYLKPPLFFPRSVTHMVSGSEAVSDKDVGKGGVKLTIRSHYTILLPDASYRWHRESGKTILSIFLAMLFLEKRFSKTECSTKNMVSLKSIQLFQRLDGTLQTDR